MSSRASRTDEVEVLAAELSRRAIVAVREAVKASPRADLPGLLAELERVRAR